MGKYIVTANSYRAPITNDAGKVVPGPRLRRGAVVELDDDRAAPLVRTGGLVSAEPTPEVEDNTPDTTGDDGTATTPAENLNPVNLDDGGAASSFDEDGSTDEDEDEEETSDEDIEKETPDVEDEDDSDEEGDGLDDMSYPALQKHAKDLTGDGGGSKADLIERIRAHSK